MSCFCADVLVADTKKVTYDASKNNNPTALPSLPVKIKGVERKEESFDVKQDGNGEVTLSASKGKPSIHSFMLDSSENSDSQTGKFSFVYHLEQTNNLVTTKSSHNILFVEGNKDW